LKIGIFTLHWVANFGANLQAYATSSYLSSLGHDVVFVNYRPKEAEDKYAKAVSEVQLNAHKRFVKKHFNETPIVRNIDDAKEIIKEINPDYLITGSDSVFRLWPVAQRSDHVFPNPFWLPFPKEENSSRPIKVALSPSAMGCRYDILPKAVQKGVNNCIADMDHISVRDAWTEQQLKKIGVQRQIQVTPDPVFLLRKKIANHKQSMKNPSPYILINSNRKIPPSWTAEFTKRANKKGYEVIALPISEGRWAESVNRKVELPLSPFEWMDWIANASGYVGVRFHPIVVSLLSGVPFVSIDTYHRGFWDASKSKTLNLLRNYNLQRYVYGRVRHLLLTPYKTLCLLDEQKKMLQKINQFSVQLDETLRNFIQSIFRTPF